MKSALGFMVALGVGGIWAPANAATAVAYDTSTGAWAYFAQVRSVSDAKRRAIARCRKRGGQSCDIIVACERGGYGRIYRYQRPGQRQVALGASCGWYSAAKAEETARENCDDRLDDDRRCGAGPLWYDAYNDKHVPDRCKKAHPSHDPCKP